MITLTSTHTHTASANNSCDKISTLRLAENPLLTKSYNTTVCANQLPYTWLRHVFTLHDALPISASGNNSCDTIRTLTLAVNPLLTKSYNTTVCANQLPYTWLGHVFTGAATLTDTASGNNSCDKIGRASCREKPLLTKSYNTTEEATQSP